MGWGDHDRPPAPTGGEPKRSPSDRSPPAAPRSPACGRPSASTGHSYHLAPPLRHPERECDAQSAATPHRQRCCPASSTAPSSPQGGRGARRDHPARDMPSLVLRIVLEGGQCRGACVEYLRPTEIGVRARLLSMPPCATLPGSLVPSPVLSGWRDAHLLGVLDACYMVARASGMGRGPQERASAAGGSTRTTARPLAPECAGPAPVPALRPTDWRARR